MDLFDDKEISEEVVLENDNEFRNFIKGNRNGIEIVHRPYREIEGVVAQPDSGDFVKWINTNKPEIPVKVQPCQKNLVLRSNDYWLPLVFLASDVTLPIYLNIVASYLYDKAKGLLKGETVRVHFSAVYENKETGTTKKFNFDGDSETLKKTIKRFDVNKFLE